MRRGQKRKRERGFYKKKLFLWALSIIFAFFSGSRINRWCSLFTKCIFSSIRTLFFCHKNFSTASHGVSVKQLKLFFERDEQYALGSAYLRYLLPLEKLESFYIFRFIIAFIFHVVFKKCLVLLAVYNVVNNCFTLKSINPVFYMQLLVYSRRGLLLNQ